MDGARLTLLAAFAVATTLLTRWMVSGFHRAAPLRAGYLPRAVGDLVWILLLLAGGLLAVRYIERVDDPALAYLGTSLCAFLLSLLRAVLYQRAIDSCRPLLLDAHTVMNEAIHTLLHVAFAIVVYLLSALPSGRPADPAFFIPVTLGALLPDLDSHRSLAGRLFPFLSGPVSRRFGRQDEWHSLGVNALVTLVTAVLIPLIGLVPWILISVGFLSHLLLDLLTPQGVMLFWPIACTRYVVAPAVFDSSPISERKLLLGLIIAVVVLVAIVGVGAPPAAPIVVPTFDDMLERYYGLRGKYLVFADVEGTWQKSGQRISGRFETLGVFDRSFIMLDRYTGVIFSAGHSSADNLFVNNIRLAQGAEIEVKPVEITIQGGSLAGALPLVYQMQAEPGLQHIIVSGDIVLPQVSQHAKSSLRPDYAQTRLRKIIPMGRRHYSLRYLTAADLIGLANVEVESADLVITGTYLGGLEQGLVTATPLPTACSATHELP